MEDSFDRMEGQPQIPTATYRLQLNRNFTFRDAAALVPYLFELGISHCYASPYLRARPGSMHGYDIVDHNSLNPEIGTSEDYEHFVSELHRFGMGQILDIVPNHMGVMGSDNAWWLDVLENGEASDFAEFFDIDWDPIKDELQGKVLIPILGDQYGNVLESGELKLTFDMERGEFSLFYHQHRFPIVPVEYPHILNFQLEQLREKLGATNEDVLELQSIGTAFSHLPGRRETDATKRAERNREKEVQKRRLAALCARSSDIRNAVLATVETFNGNPNDPRSFDSLHELIKAQVFRLAQWRVAADDINYRRFFDVNELAALRMENKTAFDSTHKLILKLVADGKVEGLRVDHPDGLYDPACYFSHLTERIHEQKKEGQPPTYLVAEKILTGSEQLRKEWPIDGTTGYEFTNLANGLFVDVGAADKMERMYRSFAGKADKFADEVYACKKLILKVGLASELNVLANLLSRIALANRHTCDFTLNSLRSALAEIISSFPVYRTYVTGREVAAEDRRYIEQAVAGGRRRSNAADLSVFEFIRRILLIEVNGSEPEFYKRAVTRFAMKFQQVTAAVMAKGLEDTAFYRYHRLISLNEVGGNPSKFGTTVDEFHAANLRRLEQWPRSMLSTSTHDSKRSEDVRTRIDALSEIPGEWRLALRRWRDWNRTRRRFLDDLPAPSRNDEYLLYQTLVGAWPLERLGDAAWKEFRERIQQYMIKAAREAKERTSWANTNTDYEAALCAYIDDLLSRVSHNKFLPDFDVFAQRTAKVGMLSSLSQTLLKLTSPGVPDTYQGNEMWDLSLVDPDNRRPVDYEKRRRALKSLPKAWVDIANGGGVGDVVSNMQDGRAKLLVTTRTLQLRRRDPDLFQQGKYIPLTPGGTRARNIVAYAREFEGRAAVIVVPRLCASLLGTDANAIEESTWGDTRVKLPETNTSCYHNLFTGECISANDGQEGQLAVAKTLRHFPVALLLSQPSGGREECEAA